MRKTKTFAKMILITLMLVSLFCVSASYATDTESPSDEIERIEYGYNCKTTYYQNGTKLVEITPQLNINIGLSAEASVRRVEAWTPPLTLENIKLIIEIVYLSVAMVAIILGIFGITLYKRSKKELKYIRHLETIKKRV